MFCPHAWFQKTASLSLTAFQVSFGRTKLL
jgi:hypothetical protein